MIDNKEWFEAVLEDVKKQFPNEDYDVLEQIANIKYSIKQGGKKGDIIEVFSKSNAGKRALQLVSLDTSPATSSKNKGPAAIILAGALAAGALWMMNRN